MKNVKKLSKASMTKLKLWSIRACPPKSWPRKAGILGVLGIVAGRLLEELGQTVIVLNIEDGRAKGSARSVEAVDIFEALDPHRDLFIAFGGHAGAAGMTLEVEKLSDLSQVLEDYVREKGADAGGKNKLI